MQLTHNQINSNSNKRVSKLLPTCAKLLDLVKILQKICWNVQTRHPKVQKLHLLVQSGSSTRGRGAMRMCKICVNCLRTDDCAECVFCKVSFGLFSSRLLCSLVSKMFLYIHVSIGSYLHNQLTYYQLLFSTRISRLLVYLREHIF